MIGNELNSLSSPMKPFSIHQEELAMKLLSYINYLFVNSGLIIYRIVRNMCHESSGAALSETLGIGKGSVTLDDFNHADVVMVIGQNPGTNHPRMLSALSETKKNGGKIITINPLPEVGLMRFKDPQNPLKWFGKGQQLTDIFLQVKINGDVALLKIIMKLLLEMEQKNPGSVFDHDFINSKTAGYDSFIANLEKRIYYRSSATNRIAIARDQRDC